MDRSVKFYTMIFGMKVANEGIMAHGGKFVHLRSPGSKKMLGLNWYPEGSRFFTEYREGEELDHLAFVVSDVKKAYKSLVEMGVEVAVPPNKSEGTEVYVKDPDGIWIELLGS
jgi:catechol 2,3-dioxygenase-like lactoylglutathione lyase family enzyme